MAAARGRSGRAKQVERQHAERVRQAAALAVDTIPALRVLLLEAARMAYVNEDVAALVRVVSVGAELIKTADLEDQVAELRQLVADRIPGAAGRLGVTS